jgi:acyl-CoA thioester hydrolase
MREVHRRRRGGYFGNSQGVPGALVARVKRRIQFSDVDPMAILWHGRYANLFEHASEELGRACGLGYGDYYREKLRAPIVQLHVDYFAPVTLGEEVTIIAKMVWDEGARINTEFEVVKESGTTAATGYTVQMFVDEAGEALLGTPPILERCRRRWRDGEFGQLR